MEVANDDDVGRQNSPIVVAPEDGSVERAENERKLDDDGKEEHGSSFRDEEEEWLIRNVSIDRLVLARASISVVLAKVVAYHEGNDDGTDNEQTNSTTCPLLQLAQVVESEWKTSLPSCMRGRQDDAGDGGGDTSNDDNDDGAASRRYLRHLVEQVMMAHEDKLLRLPHEVSDASEGWDDLCSVWATILACPLTTKISESASSVVTFHLPLHLLRNDDENASLDSTLASPPSNIQAEDCAKVRFRIYPYHNDVALRLWEAGVVLAEMLASNDSWRNLITGKRVVELGSGGVGLTGLVTMLCCHPVHYTFTDASVLAIRHLLHNLEWNHSLLDDAHTCAYDCLCYDWNEAIDPAPKGLGSFDSGAPLPSSTSAFDDTTLDRIASADVLLAADVAYDETAIPGLVETLRLFFTTEAPEDASREPRLRRDVDSGTRGDALHHLNDSSAAALGNEGVGSTDDAGHSQATVGGKVAILAVTRRRRSTFEKLLHRLQNRLLLDGSMNTGGDSKEVGRTLTVTLEPVLGSSTCDEASNDNRLPPPPILFPTNLVQPRRDVAVFVLRRQS